MTNPIRGEQGKPRLWQGSSLRHFGTNPYGGNLWRVVWAPSRKWLAGGMWQDRSQRPATDSEIVIVGRDNYDRRVAEYRWIPKYMQKCWVLERWLSPIQYAGTPEAYALTQWDEEAKLYTLGPYPERGEYEYCGDFTEGEPSYTQIETVINLILAGEKYTRKEKETAIRADEELKQKQALDRAWEIFKESQGAFNNQASSVNPAKKTAEKVRFDYSAEDVSAGVLPVGDNKFSTTGK